MLFLPHREEFGWHPHLSWGYPRLHHEAPRHQRYHCHGKLYETITVFWSNERKMAILVWRRPRSPFNMSPPIFRRSLLLFSLVLFSSCRIVNNQIHSSSSGGLCVVCLCLLQPQCDCHTFLTHRGISAVIIIVNWWLGGLSIGRGGTRQQEDSTEQDK